MPYTTGGLVGEQRPRATSAPSFPHPRRAIYGLSSVTFVAGLEIVYNDALTDINGLSGLTSLGDCFACGSLWLEGNDALTNLDGFSSLTSVPTNVSIKNNNALTNLDGFSSLTSIGDDLNIKDNPVLTNLDGLANLISVGSVLNITGNDTLCQSLVDAVVALVTTGGLVYAHTNDDSC